MDLSEPLQEHFKKDTKDHVLQIVKDEGLHRHLVWSRPNSSIFKVELITWPHGMTVTGDMGTFTVGHPSVADILGWFDGCTDYVYSNIRCHGAGHDIKEFDKNEAREYLQSLIKEVEEDMFECDMSDQERLSDVKDRVEIASMYLDGHPEDVFYSEFLQQFPDEWESIPFQKFTRRHQWRCLAVEAIREAYKAVVGQYPIPERTSSAWCPGVEIATPFHVYPTSKTTTAFWKSSLTGYPLYCSTTSFSALEQSRVNTRIIPS